MAASRSTRVTRSSVGINGLDENFCGRTLRNRSIAHTEDSLPILPQRARSPKKKQDCLQVQTKGVNLGKVSDVKQQQSTRDSWVSPRKRGISGSERDFIDKQSSENCETKPLEAVSPISQKIKRGLRPGELNSSEEDSPSTLDKSAFDSKDTVIENNEDVPSPKRARLCLILDDCDNGEVKKKESSSSEFDKSVLSNESHVMTNGLDDQVSDEIINCNDSVKSNKVGTCVSSVQTDTSFVTANDKSLSILNGNKVDPTLDPDVPCKNLYSELPDVDAERMTADSNSPSELNDNLEQPSVVSLSENPLPFREPEEEVDVVGDSSCTSKECVENANGVLCAVQDNKDISGETVSPLGLDSCLAEVTSFMEPQEHRYTLRTSPRKVPSNKGSPHKLSSPTRDNVPDKEEKDSLHGRNMQDELGPVNETCGQTYQGDDRVTSTDTINNSSEAEVLTESGLSNSKPLSSANELLNSNPTEDDDEEEEEPDVYYFESDHLALKHNKDYQRLLQTIALLEAQRAQAIQDLEALARYQKEALTDPISFVEQLQKKVNIGFPCPQRVVQLPEVSWDQYTSGLGDFEREFKNKKRNTRRLKLIFDKVGLPARSKSPLETRKDGESSSAYSTLPSSDAPEQSTSSSRSQVIRGRVYDQTKPDTFNQLWTIEEQKKLEQLLLKYPPEEIESKRWQKIADELGNRTAKQVASRVQKYFIKLTKAGIPVPGRTPNLYMYNRKASSKRQHHLNKHLYRPSTFLASYEPPVYMDDDDDQSGYYSNQQDVTTEDSDDDSIPAEYRNLPEYKELLQLKKMKKQKLQQLQLESALVQHFGYKCDGCGVDPIQGVRWHCQDCPQENCVDFCDNCSDCLHTTDTHKSDHRLEPVYRAETFIDRDYCMPQSTGYNYLDPNYFPANR
ncbi:ZZ-type zinc finger-containing protein 3 [Polypterus senegalus]|uniref:ZZ-type zinc finger-containing protein 3 n=1 Tax=Polypterus senegalus TaxID=55291 RepID=UPI001964AB8F|nr:ZZ-type zinc finger-containing protein 3 [Polypterus senegalus]XP_039591976.1 ZZ-type zinc finger-containing protein 3 [Polypterus senegalus]